MQTISFISAGIDGRVAKGVIKPVGYRPTCVSPISCVPKCGGNQRSITDLRWLNTFCHPHKFMSENINNTLGLIGANDHKFSVDLKKGFWHGPVNECDHNNLGIQCNGQYFMFRALLFRLNASPYLFHKIIYVGHAMQNKGHLNDGLCGWFPCAGKSYGNDTSKTRTAIDATMPRICYKLSQIHIDQEIVIDNCENVLWVVWLLSVCSYVTNML